MKHSIIACVWVLYALTQVPTQLLAQTDDLIPYRTKAGKWGFCDTQKHIVIAPVYDHVGRFGDGRVWWQPTYARVTKKNKQGVINRAGKPVLPIVYDEIEIFSEGFATIRQGKKYGFIDTTFTMIVPPRYDSVSEYSNGYANVQLKGKSFKQISAIGKQALYANVQLKGKWMCINTKGRICIPRRFDAVEYLQAGLWKVKISTKWGINDSAGTVVLQPYYDAIETISNRYTAVKLTTTWGIIDNTGTVVMQPYYHEIKAFSERYFAVKLGRQWGFVDTRTFKECVPPRYEEISACSDGYARVKGDGESYSMTNTQNKTASMKGLPRKLYFDLIQGYSYEESGGKYGLIDSTLHECIPPRYDNMGYLIFGHIAVKESGKWGIVDSVGNTIISPRYDYIVRTDIVAGQDYARVLIEGAWGVVDSKGVETLSPTLSRFTAIKPFSSGYAVAETGGEKCLIDPFGKEIVPPRYDEIGSESLFGTVGIRPVKANGKWGIIDHNGKEVLSPRYDKIERHYHPPMLASVRSSDKWGFLDNTLQEVVPPRYDYVDDEFQGGYVKVKAGKNFGYIGLDGTEYWEGGYTAPRSK